MATTIQKKIRRYTDVSFNFTDHPITGELVIKHDAEAVKQSVRNLLLLKKFEKPFHPEINSGIHDLLFENASPVMQVTLEEQVIRVLEAFEPRVDVDAVSVSFPEPNAVSVRIRFYIVNTTEPITIEVMLERTR